jgi:multicomponent Na+:H+ antiporter subunit G
VNLLDILAGLFVVAGASLTVVAVTGLYRLPDLYARMHAATKPATLGITLCLVGAALAVDDVSDVTKLLLAATFQLVTAPVSAHLIGRAAHEAGARQSDHTVVDELD